MNQPVTRSRTPIALCVFAAAAMGFPAFAWITVGRSLAEKAITSMLMPLPMLWMIFILATLLSWGQRKRALTFVFGLSTAILWIVASPFLSSALMQRLERKVAPWNYQQDPSLDVIVVLGGGTGRDDAGRSQQSGAGDRVGWGARLYKLGKTKKLITTGDAQPGISLEGDDPSDQTVEIWTQLGIPAEDIGTLSGINTFEELKSLKSQPELWEGKRVGLLTSAFHLPRAMRLAKSNGLELIPIASDFHTHQKRPWNQLSLLPSSGALGELELILREELAGLVGR